MTLEDINAVIRAARRLREGGHEREAKRIMSELLKYAQYAREMRESEGRL